MASTSPTETLELLFESCNSITQTALSCRTFAKDDDDDEARVIREEAIAEWLESQIIEQESLLKLHEHSKNRSSSSRRQLQQQLVDSNARLQLEQMLLSRTLASRSALSALESDDIILKEAQTRKDNLVTAVLASSRELEEVRHRCREVLDACRLLRREIPSLVRRTEIDQREAKQPGLGSDSRKKQEIAVLKNMIASLLPGSDIDWYNDERITHFLSENQE